jgi:hypothetical protein
MFDRPALCIAWALAASALMPAGALADDANNATNANAAKVAKRAPDPPADADLLEYLGSVDSEEQGWIDYLARTDITQVVKAKKSPDTTEVVDK